MQLRHTLWTLVVAAPLAGAILGCAGGTDVGGDEDATDDEATDGDDDGDDDDASDDLPDGVEEEKGGRWVPAKGFTFELDVSSGGDDRTALVHVPKKDKRKELPLVIALHGGKGGNNAERMAKYFEAHENEGVAFAFPNGLEGGESGWATEDDRDVDFIADLIDTIDDHVGVDRDHVYVTGFASGAGLAWKLECESSDLFAGFGHVQESMSKKLQKSCKPKEHKPFVWFHGDSDKKAPWEGDKDTVGVEDTVSWWLDVHECRKSHDRRDWMPDLDKDDGAQPELYRYETCKHVPALHLYKVKGGTHAWPSMKGLNKKKGDGRSRDLDTSERTLQFWKQHAGLEWDGGE